VREKEVQVKFSEFPHDMRVLIDQITEDAGAEYAEDDAEIPAGMVLTESFPAKIEGNEPGDDREFEDYLETPLEDYPPILVAHGYWIDGRHRLWAARTRGVSMIQTADISGLIPRSYVKKGRFLGKMRHWPVLEPGLPDVARFFFISPKAPERLRKFAAEFLRYLYDPEGGAKVEEYGMWDSGGCWTLAQALHDWIGPSSSMHWVVGRDPLKEESLEPLPQHVVLKIGDFYLDGNGLYAKDELMGWWRDLEKFTDLSMKHFSAVEALRYSIHCKGEMREQLAADFGKHLELP
jgi:hypothetical protein